jgi:membrane associated rhomboid family serine protease
MQSSLAFPKPGPVLKALLVIVAVLGIGLALAGRQGEAVFAWLVCSPIAVVHGEVWRLLTSGVLTSPDSYGHLIFSLLGLYFLSTDLEQRWGGKRFLAFIAGSVVLGNVLAILVDRIAPGSWTSFHARAIMFGPDAAIAATAIAWAAMNADKHILLFFVVPVRGQYLTWVTIGFCVLGVIYPLGAPPAGPIAPFGGVLAGFVFGGATSPLRHTYLRIKLWFIRRRLGDKAPPTVESILRASAAQKKRGSGPPLRVVPGGLDEKKPPKDKRYLN